MGLEDEENVPTIPFISTIHRKYGIFLNHNMKDYNLSFGQYPILIRLYDEGPSTQQNLAKIFQLNESTITRALNKLEEKEYIEKHPDYENKRKNYVKVTPKGAKIAKEVMDYDEPVSYTHLDVYKRQLSAISKLVLTMEGIKLGSFGWKLCLVIGIVIPIISAS